MASSRIPPLSISPRTITSQRLRGLISAIVEESGLDQETFLASKSLLERIENPYMEFMQVVFQRQDNGWTLSRIQMQPYAAGAPMTGPQSVNSENSEASPVTQPSLENS